MFQLSSHEFHFWKFYAITHIMRRRFAGETWIIFVFILSDQQQLAPVLCNFFIFILTGNVGAVKVCLYVCMCLRKAIKTPHVECDCGKFNFFLKKIGISFQHCICQFSFELFSFVRSKSESHSNFCNIYVGTKKNAKNIHTRNGNVLNVLCIVC